MKKLNSFIKRAIIKEELLLYLYILILISTLIYNFLIIYIQNKDINYNLIADDLRMIQLRRLLNRASEIDFNDSFLKLKIADQDYELSFKNKRLILSPGYQVFLNNLDDLYFKKDNNYIYLIAKRKNSNKEYLIAKESLNQHLPFDDHDQSD